MGGLDVGFHFICLKNDPAKIKYFIQKKEEKKLMHKNDRLSSVLVKTLSQPEQAPRRKE